MNKELLILCISLGILGFGIISLFTAPIINEINDSKTDFSKWGKLNCRLYADNEEKSNNLDEVQKNKKWKNICYRQKAMYNLEYSSLIINIVLGFVSAQLSLLLYFKIGNSIEKITGIFGIISGIICFILTLVYISFSTYIFHNDTAYGVLNTNGYDDHNAIDRLFSNGGSYKLQVGTSTNPNEITKIIYPKELNNEDYNRKIKYRELGDSQYNYNKRLYQSYGDGCHGDPDPGVGDTCPQYGTVNAKNCEYIYKNRETSVENKYLYDNWMTTIIFGFIIIALNIMLIIFGIILMKNTDVPELLILPTNENVEIKKKKISNK